MSIRAATHAASWYSADGSRLSRELDGWLDKVNMKDLPVSNARVIIAPHAGYAYSGPTAAWAYKAWDVSKAKRVFLLGPSHHVYLDNCALSQCKLYRTPLGDLRVDQETISRLHETGKFRKMKLSVDEDEHSLEMHLPYIFKMLSRAFGDAANLPPIVPILVGSTSKTVEKEYGALLAPYLKDPSNVFVVSSDFAHWGQRFRYTYYLPDLQANITEGKSLRSSDKGPFDNPKIYESIEKVDRACMDAIESGDHEAFVSTVKKTGNTVCGQHPIGVIMAALAQMEGAPEAPFKFIDYSRSSDCTGLKDSSVSYASAYARP